MNVLVLGYLDISVVAFPVTTFLQISFPRFWHLALRTMASAADVMARAAALAGGQSPAPKRQRQGAQQSEVDTEMAAVLERCLRLSLQTAEKAESSACANNLVFLVKQEAEQKALAENIALWVSALPERRVGQEPKAHELGEKRVFLFVCMLQQLKSDTDLSDGTFPQPLDALLGTDMESLSRWISSFEPRYAEAKAGRVWVWELAVSTLAPEKFKHHLDTLSSLVNTDRWRVAPHRWGQTGLNKAVWDDVKRMAASRRA